MQLSQRPQRHRRQQVPMERVKLLRRRAGDDRGAAAKVQLLPQRLPASKRPPERCRGLLARKQQGPHGVPRKPRLLRMPQGLLRMTQGLLRMTQGLLRMLRGLPQSRWQRRWRQGGRRKKRQELQSMRGKVQRVRMLRRRGKWPPEQHPQHLSRRPPGAEAGEATRTRVLQMRTCRMSQFQKLPPWMPHRSRPLMQQPRILTRKQAEPPGAPGMRVLHLRPRTARQRIWAGRRMRQMRKWIGQEKRSGAQKGMMPPQLCNRHPGWPRRTPQTRCRACVPRRSPGAGRGQRPRCKPQ
jgi:hypothetical protein